MLPAKGDLIPVCSMGVVTQSLLKEFANASLDFNPIHLDPQVAERVGLPGVIAHGMLIAGFLGEVAQRYQIEKLGSTWKVGSFQARFKAMTVLGEEIVVDGLIKGVSESALVLELSAKNPQGEIKCLATVTLAPSQA